MKIMYRVTAGLISVLFMMNAMLFAEEESAEPIQEVFRSDLVFPQERGEIQITAAPYFLQFEDNKSALLLPLGLEFGLTDSWQVEIESDSRLWQDGNRSSSAYKLMQIELSLMYSFMNILDSDFHTAIGIEVEHSIETSEAATEFGISTILAKNFPALRNAQIFGQYLLQFEESEVGGDGNIGFYLPLGTLTFTTEINFRQGDEKQDIYSTNGLIWAPKSNINVGIGFSAPLSESSAPMGVYSLFIYEFDLD